ncbi:MAG TPA: Mut7-C RNAse domain-containing protein, partial [Candidatus Limnocylindrales bacterium]|nr:Mut7-C RNAse domain-containing protein [Candidatus Limnocylindrales bacterium]
MNAVFRFYGMLNDFLPPERRAEEFVVHFSVPGSVKDMVEAAGAPHPEVELILANGVPVEFSYLVRDGDRVAVYPAFFSISVPSLLRPSADPAELRFVLDAHLGTLAGYLRMAGFDAAYRNDSRDDELAGISSRQSRILLTRDRGLLKRTEVVYGYFVRNTEPRRQFPEVVRRYSLLPYVRPFLRCIRCNGLLRRTGKESVRSRIPEQTASLFHEFT